MDLVSNFQWCIHSNYFVLIQKSSSKSGYSTDRICGPVLFMIQLGLVRPILPLPPLQFIHSLFSLSFTLSLDNSQHIVHESCTQVTAIAWIHVGSHHKNFDICIALILFFLDHTYLPPEITLFELSRTIIEDKIFSPNI